jgi:hydrogenase maturation protease
MADIELSKIDWKACEKLLFLGIGNPGRQDDGLGPQLIERLESLRLPQGVSLEANYQLNAEDSLLISDYEVVVFVDATVEPDAPAPFSVRPAMASDEIGFSTHAMSVGAVIALCEKLYDKKPRTYLMTLPGYEWEISEQMSEAAADNLDRTVASLKNLLCPGVSLESSPESSKERLGDG